MATRQPLTVGLVVLTSFLVRPLAYQVAAGHAAIEGMWHLDEDHSNLSAENWKSRQTTRQPQNPPFPVSTEKLRGELALVAFGPPLLSAPLDLTINVGTISVMINGDFGISTTYDTTGKRQTVKVVLGAPHRSAPPSGRTNEPPRSENVSVKTTWVDQSLVQELSSEVGGTKFSITRTFLPSTDGRQLFVLIDLGAPKVDPAVKPIRRVYVRPK